MIYIHVSGHFHPETVIDNVLLASIDSVLAQNCYSVSGHSLAVAAIGAGLSWLGLLIYMGAR